MQRRHFGLSQCPEADSRHKVPATSIESLIEKGTPLSGPGLGAEYCMSSTTALIAGLTSAIRSTYNWNSSSGEILRLRIRAACATPDSARISFIVLEYSCFNPLRFFFFLYD